MKYDYNDLVGKLKRAVVSVTFTKVDGTERVMRCTLVPVFLPEEHRDLAPMLTETAPVTIAVWDVDVSAWRSFRLENVTDATVIE